MTIDSFANGWNAFPCRDISVLSRSKIGKLLTACVIQQAEQESLDED